MKLQYSLFTALLIPALTHAAFDLGKAAKEYVVKAEQCKREKKMNQAFEHYKNAIALDPHDFMLVFNFANELYNNSRKEEALAYYDMALEIRPEVEQAHFNRGMVLTQLDRFKEAAESFMQAIKLNPNYIRAYIQAGNAFERCSKQIDAVEIYKQGLAIEPNNAELHYRLGNLYKYLDRFEDGVTHLRKAAECDTNNHVYKLELANALHFIDGSAEALKLYEQVLQRNPNNISVLYNFGYTLKKMGHFEKAIEVYDKVLEMNPNYANAHFSRSLSYLTLGDWKQGWKEYEWRWAAYDETPQKFNNAPVWDGSNLHGKRILLYAEQGLGDTVQFIRYAELVKAQGAYVIVETQSALKDLLCLCPYIDEVYARGQKLPEFDTQIALMSLPLIFKTRVDSVPDTVPYIFAKPELVAYWADQLKDDHNLKIGICWQGNPNYRTQFLRQAVASKSMHVTHFEPIARLNGVSLYNLQKMGGEEQLHELSSDIVIHSFGEDLDTKHGRFMDTVAIMKNLDLIITIDTGTCHVAAALGVPTWNLLPNPADWRWMLDRNDTPWYNNMRLFKQPKPGDWEGAIAECIQALKPILSGQKTIQEVTQEKGIFREHKPIRVTSNTKDLETAITTQPHNEPVKQLNTDLFKFEELKNSPEDAVCKSPSQSSNKVDLGVENLTAKLLAINKQLLEYDKKIKASEQISVFNQECMELIQNIAALFDEKNRVKNEIRRIIQEEITPSIQAGA